jgi:hypothetical protein
MEETGQLLETMVAAVAVAVAALVTLLVFLEVEMVVLDSYLQLAEFLQLMLVVEVAPAALPHLVDWVERVVVAMVTIALPQ